MVSTKTQIAGFEFDNCLMNAAGVACMTIGRFEGAKNSAAGTLLRRLHLGLSSGHRSHDTRMFHLVLSTHGLPNGLD